MVFIVTCLYGAALFGAGLWFVRRGDRTPGQDAEGKVFPLAVKEGDRILFGKYSGTEIKIDGEEFIIMKENVDASRSLGEGVQDERRSGKDRRQQPTALSHTP